MNQKGFTLLEVMLALSIISAALVGLISAYSLIDQSRLSASLHARALLLQDQKLHEILRQDNFSRLSEGQFDPPFEHFEWQAVQEAESKVGFKRVRLTISWMARQAKKELTISTYVRKKNGLQIKN